MYGKRRFRNSSLSPSGSPDQLKAREFLEGRALHRLDDFFRRSSRLSATIRANLSGAPKALRRLRRRRRRAPPVSVLFDDSRTAQEARKVNQHFIVLHFQQKMGYRRSRRFRKV